MLFRCLKFAHESLEFDPTFQNESFLGELVLSTGTNSCKVMFFARKLLVEQTELSWDL